MAIILVLLFPAMTLAAIPGFGGPFGGKIIAKKECAGADWITVGPPKPGIFMVTSATKKYDYKKIRMGEWVLGLSLPIPTPCFDKYTGAPTGLFGKLVLFVGTSKIFGL